MVEHFNVGDIHAVLNMMKGWCLVIWRRRLDLFITSVNFGGVLNSVLKNTSEFLII